MYASVTPLRISIISAKIWKAYGMNSVTSCCSSAWNTGNRLASNDSMADGEFLKRRQCIRKRCVEALLDQHADALEECVVVLGVRRVLA